MRVSPSIPVGSARSNCYLCNGAQRDRNGTPERMISTDVHIEYEGGIAICETCVRHMGRLLDLLTPDDVAALVREVEELVDAAVVRERRLEAVERNNEALRVLLAGYIEEIPTIVEVAPEPEPEPEPEVEVVDPLAPGLAILAEIQAQRAEPPPPYVPSTAAALAPSRQAPPTWNENDGVDEALAREHAEVDT